MFDITTDSGNDTIVEPVDVTTTVLVKEPSAVRMVTVVTSAFVERTRSCAP